MKNKIAIVNSSSFGTINPNHIDELEKIGEVKRFKFDKDISGDKLAEELQGYNIIIASTSPNFNEEFFANKDELLLISRHGIGYNNVDLDAAKKHNTLVTIVPALVEREAVAENNITNLLNVMRRTTESANAVRNDKWETRAQFVGNSIYNKTVGVIGAGNTGSCVIETLRYGFRCDVLAYDPGKTAHEIAQHGAKKVELDYLYESADIICVCSILTEDNYHMISYDAIDKMKDGVYISNSSRGALLDEQAVVEGLRSGKIAGLACDVLEKEPGRADHPYLQFDNVLMTPHTAAYTQECLGGMGDKCVQDVRDVVNGVLPKTAVQAEANFLK